ncbi:MAG: Enoyl-CoA hydratase [Rhodoferax sp.]|nr:Enoyl-CoA hydratase [Rhodoferax sp.]
MHTNDYSTIACQVADDGILTLTLNRPDRLNAFTVRMAEELIDAFTQASDDDAVRAVVVTGAGRAFCAGMDLADQTNANVFGLNESLRPTMRDMDERFDDPEIVQGVRDTGGRVTLAIFACKKPVIAAVNGVAVGIGSTMTLAMDVRIATAQARFGFVFGKLGIVPEACSSWFLPRVVGLPKALEWTYSAELISAQAALDAGLVSQLVAPEALLEEAYRIARQFTSGRSPVSVALIRQMMYRNSGAEHPVQAHKVESLAVFYASLQDGKEGVAAFREKRSPAFRDQASKMPDFYPWWE